MTSAKNHIEQGRSLKLRSPAYTITYVQCDTHFVIDVYSFKTRLVIQTNASKAIWKICFSELLIGNGCEKSSEQSCFWSRVEGRGQRHIEFGPQSSSVRIFTFFN